MLQRGMWKSGHRFSARIPRFAFGIERETCAGFAKLLKGGISPMFIALGILLSLIGFSPFILTLGGQILPNLAPLFLAIGLGFVAVSLEPAEAKRFFKLTLPFIAGAAVLALWLLLQMLPLPLWQEEPLAHISSLAHPVWTSTLGGFSQTMTGSITVDTGATAIALVRYLCFVGVILLSTALSISRDRAEAVLIGLTIATGLIAMIAGATRVFGGAFLIARDEALVCTALGVSISAVAALLAYEKQAKRRMPQAPARWHFSAAFLACLAVFLVCTSVIATAGSGSLIFATAIGFSTFGAVLLVRRLELGRWGASTIGATALVIAAALVTGAAGTSTDLRLTFVKKDAAALELTQRILADAPILGDGAGTFVKMLPIYQAPEVEPDDLEAVTAAAQLSIELGRPVLWAIFLAAVVAMVLLLRGAANRRRDFFYPAAGAACLVTLIILAFINVGVLGSAVPILAGTILGLALAQSQSSQIS
jgi:hypothetical protein